MASSLQDEEKIYEEVDDEEMDEEVDGSQDFVKKFLSELQFPVESYEKYWKELWEYGCDSDVMRDMNERDLDYCGVLPEHKQRILQAIYEKYAIKIPQENNENVQLYKLKAEKGDPEAQLKLGICYK